MATLQAVQYSQNGEALGAAQRKATVKDISGLVKYDPKIPIEEKEWVVFKLVDNNKEGGVYIPNIDDVINPATGKVERIRLLSGINTIWQKDQKDLTPEYIRKNMRNIEFPRKVKIRRVKSVDSTMIEFMRICNYNIGNVNRIAGNGRFEFYEYDYAAAEKEQFQQEEYSYKMETIARTEKEEPMRKHAAFLGIRMVNENGERKSEEGVRREYARYAKLNPAYFERTRNTEQIEISWLVRKAISESFIEIGREPGKIFWAQGGGMICAMPQGVNAQEYLTDLAMTNSQEGTTFKEQLKKVAI